MRKGKKSGTLAKLKLQNRENKHENSGEKYAVALKYDYRLTEAQFRFEELRNQNKLSNKAKFEYAGLLIKTRNYQKALDILQKMISEGYTDERANQMVQISQKLLNEKCIEYKSGTETLSSYCYTFNAEMSVNPVQPNIVYTWNFDSKDTLEGTEIDYCFDVSGTHLIKLGSYDKDKAIVNTDTAFTISILPPLDFNSMKENNIINKTISFNYKEQLSDNQKILWHFGNGIFKTGKSVSYFFNRPGNYFIEFFIIEKDTAQSSLKCNSCQLFINQNKAEQKANK